MKTRGVDQSDYGLIVNNRKPVGLEAINGELINLKEQPLCFDKPLTLTEEPDPIIVGVSSGVRSALARVEGKILKIKGCLAKQAVATCAEGHVYRETRLDDPWGTMTEDSARSEIDGIAQISSLLESGGFVVPYSPVQVMNYQARWQPDFSDESWHDSLKPLYNNPYWRWRNRIHNNKIKKKYKGKMEDSGEIDKVFQQSALVTEVLGDTRLIELIRSRYLDRKLVKAISYQIGLSVGAQLRITDNWHWGANLHLGNFILFEHEGEMHTCMTDFDGLVPSDSITNNRERLHHIERVEWVAERACHYRVKFFEYIRRGDFSDEFEKGVLEGCYNPDHQDTRSGVPLTEVHSAFDTMQNAA